MEKISFAMGIVQLAVSAIGLGYIAVQLGQAVEVQRQETERYIILHHYELFEFLSSNQLAYDFIYKGKDLPSNPTPEEERIANMVALMYIDLFEHQSLQLASLDLETGQSWRQWMRNLYESSPVLRKYYRSEDYSPKLKEVLLED